MHSKRLLGSNDAHWAHEWSSAPHRAHRLLKPISSAAEVSALRAANHMPKPGHVDIFGTVLRDSASSGWGARFRRGSRRRRTRRPVAVLVLVAPLAVLPVTH